MTWVNLFAIWPDKALLPSDTRRVELIGVFWVGGGEVRNIGRRDATLLVRVEGTMPIALLYILKRNSSL
jgi:hypothetical protein